MLLQAELRKVDINHPLAGKDLKATVTLMSCEDVAKTGVQSVTLTPGDGSPSPRFGDQVTICYEAVAKGKVFDTSSKKGFAFQLGSKALVPGLEKAISAMSPGQKARIHVPAVPAGFGYASLGKGTVPANVDLIYEVELLKIGSELELAL